MVSFAGWQWPFCCSCSDEQTAPHLSDERAEVPTSQEEDASVFPAAVVQTRAAAWAPQRIEKRLQASGDEERAIKTRLTRDTPTRPPPLPPPSDLPPEEEHCGHEALPQPEDTPEPAVAAFAQYIAHAKATIEGDEATFVPDPGSLVSGEVKQMSARAEAALSALSSANAQLQVLLHNSWTPMHADDTKKMIQCLQAGHSTFKAAFRGGVFLISFISPCAATQTNVKTGRARKLRILAPSMEEPLQEATSIKQEATKADTEVAPSSAMEPLAQKATKAVPTKDRQKIPAVSEEEASCPSRQGGAAEEGAAEETCQNGEQRLEVPVDNQDECSNPVVFTIEATDSSSSCLTMSDRQRQEQYGPQSKRGGAMQYQLKVLEDNAHALGCFTTMQQQEERLCGEWAVFYHSYSHAALLYEVHAAVASVLFGFNSELAPLPRILLHEFKDVPDVTTLLERYNTKYHNNLKDHDPAYRAVALSAMCSLVALGPEASTPVVFVAGYSQKDLSFRGVLENLLLSCFVPKAELKSLAQKVIELAECHGLDVSQFGGKECKSGKAGHLLQIFIRRELLDTLAYAAVPWGAADPDRQPLSRWLNSDESTIWGQARILAHPEYFLEPNAVQMFVASADPTYHASRRRFQEDITRALHSVLGDATVRRNAARGIYGGGLPAWWNDSGGTDGL
mmetsp:Transcript_75379/g.140595  ORF Transcript_75379/g.140595 Transcript_75379/m.140595 type:complete len:679 (+) Transcript_75379:44-2080(+)